MVHIQPFVALTLAILACGHLAAAEFLHSGKHPAVEPTVLVSGPRVSGARTLPQPSTKSEKIKAALGLGGATVAPVVPPGCSSIFGLVHKNPNFTFLDQAIQVTGLQSVLDDPALVATVFAPNDAAFTRSLGALGITPQELFSDVAALAVILKYHVLPGVNLEAAEFRDDQQYYTLLTDSKKNTYTLVFNYEREIDLKALKRGEEAVTEVFEIVPSGSAAANIIAFDLNAGCPSIAHVVDRVLLPDYNDAAVVELADSGLSIWNAYQEINRTDALP